MKIEKLSEYGLEESSLGFSLSYNSNPKRAKQIFKKYAHGLSGEDKFLESIITYWSVDAPRYWWSEADTYRVGTTKQSESTMHTITKRLLTQDDFELPVFEETLNKINELIKFYQSEKSVEVKNGLFEDIKNNLPEGFLQRRIWMLSYKTIKNIYWQRKTHRLRQWRVFTEEVLKQLNHKEFIVKEEQ